MKVLSPTHALMGENIKKRRLAKKMTQDTLAQAVGVDRSYAGFVERGLKNPTLLTVVNVAKALDVDITELFDFTAE